MPNPWYGFLENTDVIPILPLPDIGEAVERMGRALAILLTQRLHVIGPHRPPIPPFWLPAAAPATFALPDSHVGDVLWGQSDRVQAVNAWLDRLEIGYRIELVSVATDEAAPLAALRLADQASGLRLWPNHVGYGVGQVLPILVGMSDTEPRVFLDE